MVYLDPTARTAILTVLERGWRILGFAIPIVGHHQFIDTGYNVRDTGPTPYPGPRFIVERVESPEEMIKRVWE
jgi:hypothetical protein